MLGFKDWILSENKQFTGMTPDGVNYWAKYAQRMNFKSVEEARAWIFRKMELGDQNSPFVYGTEYNKAFSDAMPIYQSGKSFKIGKRVREDKRFRLSSLRVTRPSLEELNQVAQANGESDYQFHPMKWISVSYLHDDKDYYLQSSKEMDYIQELAETIKRNGWIEAVIYDYSDGSIIEGQHRARAMKFLGFNTVPGIGIEYDK